MLTNEKPVRGQDPALPVYLGGNEIHGDGIIDRDGRFIAIIEGLDQPPGQFIVDAINGSAGLKDDLAKALELLETAMGMIGEPAPEVLGSTKWFAEAAAMLKRCGNPPAKGADEPGMECPECGYPAASNACTQCGWKK